MESEKIMAGLDFSQFPEILTNESIELNLNGDSGPPNLEEWKEETLKREVLTLFIEYFCIKQRVPLRDFMNHLEKSILMRALSRFNGNQKEAAKFLGVKHTTINQKVKKYNIIFHKRPF